MISWLRSGELGRVAQFRFSSRYGGVSEQPYAELNVANWVGDDPENVAANLKRVSDEIALPIFAMKPVHGTDVLDVASQGFKSRSADILVTTERNIALLAPSADCVSVVLAAKAKPFLMLAHIGWRGAAAGISRRIVSSAQLYGIETDELEIVLGPAICGKCYPVSDAVHDEVVRELPAASTKSGNQAGLDLRAGLVEFFSHLGSDVISDSPCTFESNDLFSYRRDNQTGRQAVVAWLS
ncbi:MAG: polyphenol oxidase family protein [Candidatus Nanopelagicales bacterium]